MAIQEHADAYASFESSGNAAHGGRPEFSRSERVLDGQSESKSPDVVDAMLEHLVESGEAERMDGLDIVG